MIQVIQAPLENSLLLDGNNTLIKVKSDRGAGYYFRTKIYIDNVLFDEQGWSRIDDEVATKDLLNLYRAYFKPIFLTGIFNGITEQTHLIRKVKIEVSEYKLEDDSLEETVTLPEYFIMYSNKPFSFDDSVSYRLLEENSEVSMMPINGKISIPFYNKGEVDNVTVKIQKQDMTIVDSYTTAPHTDKKVFLFNYDLAAASLSENDLYLKVIFEKAGVKSEKLIKLYHLPSHQVRQLSILSLFGFYKNIYVAGELEAENSYKYEDYTDAQGQDVMYEVNSETEFSLNTGNLLSNEKDIVHQICTSLDIRFFFEENFLKVISKTAKNLFFRSKKHLYNTELKLKSKAKPWIDNLLEVNLSIMNSFEISVTENVLTPIDKAFILSHFSGGTPVKIRFKELGQGELKIVTTTGDVVMVENDEYVLADVLGFSYNSGDIPLASGSVHTSVKISINDGFWSNFGTMGITIIEEEAVPPLETPQVNYNDIQILRDSSGNGTHTIVAGFFQNYIFHFTDPDHPYTVLWEIVGTPTGVTLVNETTAYPTINTTSASPDSFQIKVTATCENGFDDQIVNVNQFDETIKLERTYFSKYFTSGGGWLSGTQIVDSAYKIINGVPGTTIDIVYSANWVFGNPNYVIGVDYGLSSQFLLPYHGGYSVTKTFNSSGEIIIPIVKLYSHTGLILNTYWDNVSATIHISNNASGMIDIANSQFSLRS